MISFLARVKQADEQAASEMVSFLFSGQDSTDDLFLLNSEQAGEFFGVSGAAIRRWHTQGCPKIAMGPPNPTLTDVREAAKWLARVRSPKMMDDDESRKLDRQLDQEVKQLRIQREKISVGKEMGRLMPVDHFSICWDRMAAILRTVSKRLLQKYGQDAQGLLNDGLDQIEIEIERLFPT